MYDTLPSIADPSCPDVTFGHRWDQARYTTFRKKIHDYSAWVAEAYDEPVKDTSIELWQKIFGPDFKAPAAALPAVTKTASVVPYVRAPQEQFIEERGYGYNLSHKATIEGHRGEAPRVPARQPSRDGIGRQGGDGLTSAFAPMSRRRTPFSGRSATSGRKRLAVGQLRGLIEDGTAAHTKRESTSYAGTHWVECYVVKDRVVRATDRHLVRIR